MAKTAWQDLYDKREELLAEADALIDKAADEKRGFTDEEQEAYDAKLAEAERLADTADRLKEKAKRAAAAEKDVVPNHEPPGETRIEVGEDRRTLEPWAKGSRGLGDFMVAVARTERNHNVSDPRVHRAIQGASEKNPSDGGFLVDQDVAAGILQLMHETGQVARRCRRVPVSTSANSVKFRAVNETSRAAGSRFGGVSVEWLDEGATISKSKPTFRTIELHLHKCAGLLYATDELLADAAAFGSFAEEAFASELAFELDDRIINGTGAGQPLGVLQATNVRVQVNKESGQAATTFKFENAVKMYARLYSRGLGSAAWFVNQDVFPQLYTMSLAVGTGGAPVYLPGGSAAGSPYASLMGLPVIPIEQAKTLGTAGDVILADFSQYLLAEKGGVQADMSMHVEFTSAQTVFRVIIRVDGQPWWSSALTPAQGTNTVSPFVIVQGRS